MKKGAGLALEQEGVAWRGARNRKIRVKEIGIIPARQLFRITVCLMGTWVVQRQFVALMAYLSNF
jgi:hypothetical protein